MTRSGMPKNLKAWAKAAAKADEQCETAWTHITNCDRCEGMVFFLTISGAINNSAFPDDTAELVNLATKLMKELFSREEIRELTRILREGK